MRWWFLPGIITLFCLISIITLNSVAPTLAKQQFIFFCVGLLIFFFVSRLESADLFRFRWLGYALLITLLTITLIIGSLTRGTMRWIDIGDIFSIQGSQLAVPIVGLALVPFIVTTKLKKVTHYLRALGYIIIPAGLIMIAPDLGTTIVFAASTGSLLWVYPTPAKFLIATIVCALLLAPLGWFLLKPYQKLRLHTYLWPEQNQETSYNVQQALIAVGSGQFFGRGLGQGSQSHLRFLPERHTDFIFASLAEEWGFLGSSLVLILYIILITSILRTAFVVTNHVYSYYCVLTATFIGVQAGVNIGMNLHLLPITGITLPLLSYGGSSLISILFNLGIVQRIAQDAHLRGNKTLHLG